MLHSFIFFFSGIQLCKQGYRLMEKKTMAHGVVCRSRGGSGCWIIFACLHTSPVILFLWIRIIFEFYLSHALAQNIPPWKMILNSNVSSGPSEDVRFHVEHLKWWCFFHLNADDLCPGQVYIHSSLRTFVWIKVSESPQRLDASGAQVFFHRCLNMWRQIIISSLSEVK